MCFNFEINLAAILIITVYNIILAGWIVACIVEDLVI